MIQDILTVMWKERREAFRYQGNRSRLIVNAIILLGFAIIFPVNTGHDWLVGVLPVLLSVIIPLIIVAITIPDSFAGERERHTLDTLLASRLPDKAILFGKIGNTVMIAWGVVLVILFISLISVNIAHGQGELLFFSPIVLWGSVSLSLLATLFFSSIGIAISLRSKTAQSASQSLAALFLLPPAILMMIGMIAREPLYALLRSLDGPQMLSAITVALILLNSMLLAWIMKLFNRSWLSLD